MYNINFSHFARPQVRNVVQVNGFKAVTSGVAAFTALRKEVMRH